MKKTLLAGIATLFLATGTAHADDQLPEYMLGRWCRGVDVSTKEQRVFFQRPNGTCGDMTEGIVLNSTGYDDDSSGDVLEDCVFNKIERKEENTYHLQVHCTVHDDDGVVKKEFNRSEELQLVNGLLFIKRGPDT